MEWADDRRTFTSNVCVSESLKKYLSQSFEGEWKNRDSETAEIPRLFMSERQIVRDRESKRGVTTKNEMWRGTGAENRR